MTANHTMIVTTVTALMVGSIAAALAQTGGTSGRPDRLQRGPAGPHLRRPIPLQEVRRDVERLEVRKPAKARRLTLALRATPVGRKWAARGLAQIRRTGQPAPVPAWGQPGLAPMMCPKYNSRQHTASAPISTQKSLLSLAETQCVSGRWGRNAVSTTRGSSGGMMGWQSGPHLLWGKVIEFGVSRPAAQAPHG
jgi:hypothetical protein